ncbi:MAG: hypothetical protein RJB13_143 [Pseudomonadota bacterium]
MINSDTRRTTIIRKLALSTLSLALAGVANAQSQKAGSFQRLQEMVENRARVSAFAVNLRTHEILGQLNPDERLTPASVSKIVIAAAALEKFGADHSFVTGLFATGPVQDGVLKGDLVFVGAGDPYLTNEKLWFLATDVARAGIRRVTGNLVVNSGLFQIKDAGIDRKLAQKSSRHAYDSPLSAAAVNFSVMGFVVSPGQKKGDKAYLALEPHSLATSRIEGRVMTNSGSGSRVSVSRSRRGTKDVFTASGTIGHLASPVRVYRSVSDPDEYAGSVLRAFLEKDGVQLNGEVKVATELRQDYGRHVATVEGFPIGWQLLGLFKVSNNFIGDMLTLQLDTVPGQTRAATLSGGAAKLESYAKEVVASAPKLYSSDVQGLALSSGSGLTHQNRMSARDVVAVLQRMYSNTREFPAFLSALPVPGAEGTVRSRFASRNTSHLRDRLRAKTGTLSEPRDAVGLAGYSRLANGDWIAFCTIVNGSDKNPSVGIETARRTIDEDLGDLLPPEM